MYKAILLTTTLLAALPLAASTSPLNRTADNALRTCSTAFKTEAGANIVLRETYYERVNGSHRIYANLREYRNGEARTLRGTCETNAVGRGVVALELAADSKWVPASGG